VGKIEYASARQEWARNWKIPIISALGTTLSLIHLFSFGVFVPSIEDETGWSRSQVSAGFTFVYLMLVVISPFLGRFIDHFGPRPIALLGVACYSLALASFALVGESIGYWWVAWLALGLGHVMVSTPVWASAVVSLFEKSRGLAIAIALCGSGIASAFVPIVADILLSKVGWRGAYLTMALCGGATILMLAWLFFHPLKAQHSSTRSRAGQTPVEPAAGTVSVRKSLLSWTLARMALSGFLMTLIVVTFMVHFVPILLEGGISTSTAASIASVIGFCSILGRLVVGLVLDHVRANLVGFAVFAIPGLVCMIMLTNPGVGLAIVCAALIGFTVGAEYDVIAYAISRYFDLRLYGTLFGVVFAASCMGSAVGPLSGALIYDYFGSYRYLFLAIIPLALLNAILIGSLGPYPKQSQMDDLNRPSVTDNPEKDPCHESSKTARRQTVTAVG